MLPHDRLSHHFLGFFLGLRYKDSPLEHLELSNAESSAFAVLKNLLEVETVGASCLVVMFEDMHWADEGSIRFLKYLREVRLGGAVMVIAIARSEARCIEELKWDQLVLRPFDEETTERFLGEGIFKGKGVESQLAQTIHKKAQGNPLFLEELAKSLSEQGVIEKGEQEITITREIPETFLPTSIWQLLEARLDRLERPQRQVLEIGSVIGDEFSHRPIEELLGTSLKDELDRLIDAGFIDVTRPDKYTFKHTLIREATYRQLTKKERKGLHLKLVEYLQQDPEDLKDRDPLAYYTQLAHHSEAGEDIKKAYDCYEKAADLAKAGYINEEAIRCYSKMIHLSERLGVKPAKVLEERADTMFLIGRLDDALKDYEELRDLIKEHNGIDSEPEWLIGIARVLLVKGDTQRALLHIQEAESKIHLTNNRFIQGKIYHQLGRVLVTTGRIQDALRYTQKARLIFMDINDRKTLSEILCAIGGIYFRLANYPEVFRFCEDALKIAKQIGDKRTEVHSLSVIGNLHLRRGDYHKALGVYQETLDRARGIGHPRMALGLFGLGNVYFEKGGLREALRYFEEALKIGRRMGIQSVVVVCLNNIGDIWCRIR
jgi:tetratricopeptide (TPR) repeat protein